MLMLIEMLLFTGAATACWFLFSQIVGSLYATIFISMVLLLEGLGYIFLIIIPLWESKKTRIIELNKWQTEAIEHHIHFNCDIYGEHFEARQAILNEPKYRNLCYLGAIIWNWVHIKWLLWFFEFTVGRLIKVGWVHSIWNPYKNNQIAVDYFLKRNWKHLLFILVLGLVLWWAKSSLISMVVCIVAISTLVQLFSLAIRLFDPTSMNIRLFWTLQMITLSVIGFWINYEYHNLPLSGEGIVALYAITYGGTGLLLVKATVMGIQKLIDKHPVPPIKEQYLYREIKEKPKKSSLRKKLEALISAVHDRETGVCPQMNKLELYGY